MALPAPDPIPAVFQVLSLLEYPDLPVYHRSSLEWLRDELIKLKKDPSPIGWLGWYRNLFGAVLRLTNAEEPVPPPSTPVESESAAPNPHLLAAITRLREAPSGFAQRWHLRLQEQAQMVKSELERHVEGISLAQESSSTHRIYSFHPAVIQQLHQHLSASLRGWSDDVSGKLTPSWYQHLMNQMTREQLPRSSSYPPAWSALTSVAVSFPPPPVERSSSRRSQFFNTFLRSLRSVTSIVSMVLAPISGIVLGVIAVEASETSNPAKMVMGLIAAVFALCSLGAGILYGLFSARQTVRDEDDLAYEEASRRQRAVLLNWVTTNVEFQRNRIGTLLSAQANEARAHLAEWLEREYPTQPRRVPIEPRLARTEQPAWAVSVSMSKSALAARIAQLEFDLEGQVFNAATPKSVGGAS